MVPDYGPIEEVLQQQVSYRPRPMPVAAESRAIWRVPYVLLLVRACRRNRANLRQLQLLNWGIRSSASVEDWERFLGGRIDREQATIRYEPALDRAIALATALGLLNFDEKLWHLTTDGLELLQEVDRDDRLFIREKELLSRMRSTLSQAAVNRLLSRQVRAA